MSFHIRAVEPRDADAWAELYRGYRAFYELGENPAAVAQTWEWVSTGAEGLTGLVAATPDGHLIALANLRWFLRPSTASRGLFLDDLFVAPKARGLGVGTALIQRAAQIAEAGGGTVLRWITDSDNAAARSVYDRVATATRWITYDMAPTSAASASTDGRPD